MRDHEGSMEGVRLITFSAVARSWPPASRRRQALAGHAHDPLQSVCHCSLASYSYADLPLHMHVPGTMFMLNFQAN